MIVRQSLIDDVTVIVRTVGERTTDVCRALLEAEVGAACVFSISARPFAEALRQSLELGRREARPWTLCVDADVLPGSGGVRALLTKAVQLPREYLGVEGLVQDKFFGGGRPAGNHLYRTSLLAEALEQLEHTQKRIRPEASMILKMAERGHPWFQINRVFGLHDFEQADRDIFRTCFVHAHKHTAYIPALLAQWRRGARDDRDFEVALHGLAAGIAVCRPVHVDIADPDVEAGWRTLVAAGVGRAEFSPCTLGADAVDRLIASFVEAPEFHGLFPEFRGYGRSGWLWDRFHRRWREIGFSRAVIATMGGAAMRIGAGLQRCSARKEGR